MTTRCSLRSAAKLLQPFPISPGNSVDRNHVAGFNERRHFDGNAGFQLGVFGDGRAGVAAHGVLGLGNLEGDVLGQFDTHDAIREKLGVDVVTLFDIAGFLLHGLGFQLELLVTVRIHKVKPSTIVIKVL